MYSATADRARARVENDYRWYISFFRAAKKDLGVALLEGADNRRVAVVGVGTT
jgi:hypothetical protein